MEQVEGGDLGYRNIAGADKNLWIDLDVLVHKDITDIITRSHNNITFIWNYWNDYERISLFNYGKGVSCHTNSSFVACVVRTIS